jgi:plastocyanin
MDNPNSRRRIMRTLLSGIATLLTVAATGAGCGSSSTDGGTAVLTTVEVTPATATLFTAAPGNTATLAAVGKDQDGLTIAAGLPSFSSDNDAIAGVGTDGTVTAVAAGTAIITASMTAGAVTKTGTATVTAQVAPLSALVTTPTLAFTPATVDVQAGGAVGWTFGSTPHTVTFTTGGAPADVPQLQEGSASRTFPTHGNFNYHCSIHPQMNGLVIVH